MSTALPRPAPGLSDRACVLLAACLIAAAACLHAAFLLLDCPLDLAPDEAHYWDWSRHLDWSYYSKGPLVAWIIRASCELLGPLSVSLTGNLMFAVRAPAVLFGAVLLASLYALAVQASRSHRLALAVVAVLLTHPAIAAGSSLMTIDSPYTAAWAVALALALHAVRTDALWAWLLAGLAVGLGILAKYTMVLFLPSLALFLLCGPARRGLLARPGPWLLAGVAALCCAPIVAWNMAHGWVSVLHVRQIAGAESAGLKWFGPLHYLGGQAALLLGVWFAFWLAAVVAYRPWRDGDEGRNYLWWMSVPMFAVFLVASVKKGGGEINWPVTAYLSGGVLAAMWASARWQEGSPWTRRTLAVSGATACVLGLAAVAMVHGSAQAYPALARLVGPPRPGNPYPIRRLDPTCRLRGWRDLARAVDRVREEVPGAEMAATGWTLPGMLGVYCAEHPRVYDLGPAQGERHSQYDLWRNPIDQPEGFKGRTFVVVGHPGAPILQAFAAVEKRPPVEVAVNGQPVAGFQVWVCRGYKGVARLEGGH